VYSGSCSFVASFISIANKGTWQMQQKNQQSHIESSEIHPYQMSISLKFMTENENSLLLLSLIDVTTDHFKKIGFVPKPGFKKGIDDNDNMILLPSNLFSTTDTPENNPTPLLLQQISHELSSITFFPQIL